MPKAAVAEVDMEERALKLLNELLYGDSGVNKHDPVAWIESQFVIPELNAPMQLAPYHKAVLREAYRRDENGHFVYATVVWSDIKKSIKSSIAAAVMLHRAFHTPYFMGKIIANDLKQADSRVAFYGRRAIEMNPKLSARAKVSGYTTKLDNKAIIEAVPVDPKGEAGGNDDLICFSELWAANQTAALRMWTESTLSPTKFGQSQRWVETYAGFSGESPLLEQLYFAGVVEGKQLDLSFTDEQGVYHDLKDLEVYANGSLLCLWNTVPRCEWQTNANGQAYYANEAATLDPAEFDRVHRNKWGSASSPFVPIEWWDACLGELAPLRQYQSVIVCLDAAYSKDTFAIVTVSRTGRMVELRECRVWTPPGKGEKLDFKEPKAYVRELSQRFNVTAFIYDPYQLHNMCTELRDEGVGYFEEFNQNAPRLKADKNLYDIIRDRMIRHDGSYPTMRQHILNASKVAAEGEKRDQLRIVKRSASLPIDLVAACSMAAERAAFYNIGAD